MQDYSANGFITKTWGPLGWVFGHMVSLNYPKIPTDDDKITYFNFFHFFLKVLPCGSCRDNAKINLKAFPLTMSVMENRLTLSLWFFNFHNEVNKMLDKVYKYNYVEMVSNYELMRAKCNSKSSDIHKKGCLDPNKGNIKTKCIISIVPDEDATKGETLRFDPKCTANQKSKIFNYISGKLDSDVFLA